MYWRLGKLVHRKCFSFYLPNIGGGKKKRNELWNAINSGAELKIKTCKGERCEQLEVSSDQSIHSPSCLCIEFLFCRTRHWMCQAGDGRAMIRDKKVHWKASQRSPTIGLLCCSQSEVPLTSKRSHYLWFTHLFILHSRFFDMCQILPKVQEL